MMVASPKLLRATAWSALYLVPLAVALAPTTACFGPLPEALTCPPAAKVKAGNCLPVLENPPMGCFGSEALSCLGGGRLCDAEAAVDCPAEEASCFPDGDCPDAVVEAVGDGATCARIPRSDFGFEDFPDQFACVCGAPGCGSICDGVGPIVGLSTNEGYGGLVMTLGDLVPDSGRLGLYVRLRGLGSATVVVLTGPFDAPDPVGAAYPVALTSAEEFSEVIYYQEKSVGIEPYSWWGPQDKPYGVGIIAGSTMELVTSLYEVDCVIPFVVPN
ncbi:MAG: hypothetical protein R3B72_09020 [Polyangiaceae bacterium]